MKRITSAMILLLLTTASITSGDLFAQAIPPLPAELKRGPSQTSLEKLDIPKLDFKIIEVSTGVQSLAGASLASNFVSSFTTGTTVY